MKILNLYAGIGGNRKLWDGVHEHSITAVEYNPKIAEIYLHNFPEDEVIVGDAHQYLLEHYDEFDFIWSSPPCQSHSSFRYNIQVRFRGTKPVYPDMTLYEEILFLKHHAQNLWVIENVVPYYEPMMNPQKRNRHLYWANFDIPELTKHSDNIRGNQIADLESLYGYDLSKYRLPNKRQVLRNCVAPITGREILDAAEVAFNER